MAATQHSRAPSGTVSGPHSLSLKVLRLSCPILASQTPLPHTSFGHGLDISANASRAFPGADEHSTFPLTTALTLPAAFGAAYVGEAFTCTLCVNNELPTGEGAGRKSVSGVKLIAELQTPSRPDGSVALELQSGVRVDRNGDEHSLAPGGTLQRTLCHELKDEGPHVLAVTVSYTETLHTPDGAAASGGRARTFRKLYQFVSQQLLAVRSKVTERKRREKDAPREWVLEAQLENVGEASVVLEKVWLKQNDGVVAKAMNGGDEEEREAPVLKPQDIEQLMFLVKETGEGVHNEDAMGKVVLGQLDIDWRSAMGERGSLTTGWLASRGR